MSAAIVGRGLKMARHELEQVRADLELTTTQMAEFARQRDAATERLMLVERQRDALAEMLETLLSALEDERDVNWNGGPNLAMRLTCEHGPKIRAALAAVKGGG